MNRRRGGPSDLRLQIPRGGWKQNVWLRIVLLLMFVILFYISLAPRFVPETYNITLGSRSEKDIKAPHDYTDEKATLEAREKAADKVEPVYSIVAMRNETLLEQIFNRIDSLNQDDQLTNDQKVDIFRREIPDMVDRYLTGFIAANANTGTYSDSLLEEMHKVALEQLYRLPEETYYKLPQLTSERIAEMKTVGRDVVRKLMRESLSEAETARTKVAELVNASSLSLKTDREIVQELARLVILPNRFYDKQATEEAKLEAKQSTPAVVIKQGEIVVRAGQLINQDIYDLLVEMELLKERKTYWPQLGVLLLAVLFTLALHGYGALTASNGGGQRRSNVQWLMLLLIFSLNLLLMHLVALTYNDQWPYIGYLAPVALGAMLVTLLLDLHLGFVSAFLFSLLASVILNVRQESLFDFHYGFVAAVVSFTAVLSIHRASQRSSILKAGIMVSLFGAVAVLALGMIAEQQDRIQLLQSLGFMLASGLLTAVLVIGLMPFFELTFGILSDLKLVELSNPNHPLLRKLLTETPGTYHHSVMVGNLAEAAAEAVGANGLLCRVGAFYHDIGKTRRPLYFIENQNGRENPHDKLDPTVSASIIVAHARDGAEMLKAYKLPKQIRDIAEQHHGTTFLKYFYYKARKQAQEEGVECPYTEDDFRYPGPKAQSKEAAIVGISDCVEAAVRSLNHPTVEQIEEIIRKIIKDRLDDNQFNECDLTLRELDKIAVSLKETVIGTFHSRIEYPDEQQLKPKEQSS